MQEIKSLAVFCGSRIGNTEAYSVAAQELGKAMASRGIRLVFGGGRVGIMGKLADAILESGGEVTGVIPHFLDRLELAHENVTELIKVDSMHTRKDMMFMRADGFVILPGGLGTLEECFEVITWRQLHLHDKPIVLLNIENCWRNLETLVNDIAKAGFIHTQISDLFSIVNNVDEIFAALDNFNESN